jgi:antitoxin VapB
MALSIKDPQTDALVRKLARARGTSYTGAIRLAVENELAREARPKRSFDEVMAEIQQIQDETAALPDAMTAEEVDAWMFDENGLPHRSWSTRPR